ncbi:MAG: hypothetical protein K6C09_00900 [Oscillospiraceae bacterium]|nr:hypothetical protein [Oscillospiraceae bacterium]
MLWYHADEAIRNTVFLSVGPPQKSTYPEGSQNPPGIYESPVETELYYLQSRYYDPEIFRFINADGYASTGQGLLGGNAFAYCGKCPEMGYDPSGCRPIWEHDFGNGVIGYTDAGNTLYETINGKWAFLSLKKIIPFCGDFSAQSFSCNSELNTT